MEKITGDLNEEKLLLPVDLNKEIRKSGLTDLEILRLKENSAGLYSVADMQQIWSDRIGKTSVFGDGFRGYSLGLSNYANAYESVSKAFFLGTWECGFKEHNLVFKTDIYTSRARRLGLRSPDSSRPVDNIVEVTQKYLNIISSRDVPICFFVPRNYATHSSAKVTKAEIEWCLSNPEKITNFYFVFGLYSSINTSWSSIRDRRGEKERVDVMVEAFRNYGKLQ